MPVLKVYKNGVWEDVAGMSEHTHKISDITNFPSSLPADGGNADTLDGKHADEFALVGDIPTTLKNPETLTINSTSYDGSKAVSVTGLATETYVDDKVASMVDSAPETLNTLNELAAALGDDPNFATTVATQIGNKVDKVTGKGLSTNDYTTAEKTKLAGIAEGANKTVVDTDLSSSSTNPVQNKVVNNALNSKLSKTTYEYNKELALGSTGKVCIGKFPMYDSNISVEIKSTTNTTYCGTLIIATQNINTTGGGSYKAVVYGDAYNTLTDSIKIHYGSGSNVFSVYINLPGWSKNLLHIQCAALKGEPTDIATTVSEIPANATIVPTNALKVQLDNKVDKVSGKGLSTNDYTTTEKNKLAGIAEGANKTVVDTTLSSTSTNPVQNKVVNNAISDLGVSVKMYGAKGDGTTDDTSFFQSALSENRVVFVPGGTYKLNATLVIRSNCCLELSQDTILNFWEDAPSTTNNCIEMRSSATLRGNHAIINVPYAFTGHVIDVTSTHDTSKGVVPYRHWSPQWKHGRYIYDVCIVKENPSGLHYSTDGACCGTGIYLSGDGNNEVRFIWGALLQGVRIAGAFTRGIHAINFDLAGNEDSAWNHDMRIEAVIQGCEIGVDLTNCNDVHLAVAVQPQAAENETPYAKWGVYLNDCRYIDMSSSVIWDWNANNSLYTPGGQYTTVAMYGNCCGLVYYDFGYYTVATPTRDRIYTDTPSNLEKMTIVQEPITRWFKPVDGVPYFYDGTFTKKLLTEEELAVYFDTGIVKGFTDVLATATDANGNVFNGIGYKTGVRFTSMGSGTDLTASEYYMTTGFIQVATGATVYCNDLSFADTAKTYAGLVFYNSSKNRVSNMSIGNIVNNTAPDYIVGYTEKTSGCSFRIASSVSLTNLGVTYVRLVFPTTGVGENPMIAIDEEIKYTVEGFLTDGVKVKAENIVGGLTWTEDEINALIDAKLGVIENGTY